MRENRRHDKTVAYDDQRVPVVFQLVCIDTATDRPRIPSRRLPAISGRKWNVVTTEPIFVVAVLFPPVVAAGWSWDRLPTTTRRSRTRTADIGPMNAADHDVVRVSLSLAPAQLPATGVVSAPSIAR